MHFLLIRWQISRFRIQLGWVRRSFDMTSTSVSISRAVVWNTNYRYCSNIDFIEKCRSRALRRVASYSLNSGATMTVVSTSFRWILYRTTNVSWAVVLSKFRVCGSAVVACASDVRFLNKLESSPWVTSWFLYSLSFPCSVIKLFSFQWPNSHRRMGDDFQRDGI